MSKKGKKKQQDAGPGIRPGAAPAHGDLKNNHVHVFVDDQNLFWGIVNGTTAGAGGGYRIDFGLLLQAAAKDAEGNPRFVKSAYLAGVIPDDDTFWEIAKAQGFTVRRGYLSGNVGQQRSKQDDAYLITDLTATLFEQEGPSTVVLVAGDADYVPPMLKSLEKGWRNEVAFIERGLSSALDPVTHEFRTINGSKIKYIPKK